MSEEKINVSGGLNFGGALQIAFIVLKLCKVIDWKWIWVLAPTWIGLSLFLLVLIIFAIIALATKEK